jgi:ABC-type bacteriocin/lantibiotic exporter with double-glycine peptidase domain
MVRIAQKILLQMRSEIFQQIQKLSLDFYDQHGPAT